jgi:hypothetical protein
MATRLPVAQLLQAVWRSWLGPMALFLPFLGRDNKGI